MSTKFTKKLEHEVVKFGQSLRQGRDRAFVSSVAWQQLEENIKKHFETINNSSSAEEFGTFRLSVQQHQYRPINHIQISTRTRIIGYDRYTNTNLVEKNSALVFSQYVDGKVMFILYPYSSDTSETNEKYIILKRYNSATDILEHCVVDAISKYLRYSKATSNHGGFTLCDYLFRLRLQWKSLLLKFLKGPIPKVILDLFKVQ